ncbi:MAG: hypothetical protein ABI216_06365 [Devosia sp.]
MVHSATPLNPEFDFGNFTRPDFDPWQQAADFARGLASRLFTASQQAGHAANGDLTHTSDTTGLCEPVSEQSEVLSVMTPGKHTSDDDAPRDRIEAPNGEGPRQQAALATRLTPAAAPARRPLFGK